MRFVVILFVIAVSGAVTAGAYAGPIRTSTVSILNVVQHLDMTSFRNSIGPRRVPGLKTLADYGFTDIRVNGATAEIYDPVNPWVYRLIVLGRNGTRVRVCVTDHALNGGSYWTNETIEVERRPDGMFRAVATRVADRRCPFVAR